MALMEAYLDDYGKLIVWMDHSFYGGNTDSFSLIDESGRSTQLVINGLEDHGDRYCYSLTAPADMEFGVDYGVRESHGMIVPLVYRMITHTEEFQKQFDYDGNDLGANYHLTYTDFAVWAPTAVDVVLRIKQNGVKRTYTMKRHNKGVYRIRVSGDQKKSTYVYVIKRNGVYVESLDPYSFSATGNSMESAVIDLRELDKIRKVPMQGEVCGTNAIIYEASVRDMTSSPLTGTTEHATFNALAEEGTKFHGHSTGIDYLASLGITHVQLMPVLDFRTVDEFNPTSNYNWGYDPVHYLSLEGSFTTKPNDPYARMKEFKNLVSQLHKKGLRVNLDVVFNHVYDVDRSSFHTTVPYYYFRYNAAGYHSNGSYCGNDFASDQPMARRYLIHVIEQLIKVYDVDGFRFDLMGILDTTTMNCLRDAAVNIKKDTMLYGEGWDLPTQLDWKEKACITNQDKMPHIGHFNDYFRDIVKGKTSDDQKYERGYATGDLNQAFGTLSALSANVLTEPYFMRFTSPDQCVNGIETHDNQTTWDKMHFCCANDDREVRKARLRIMLAITMFAQGIPFLHAGEEFGGTKNDNGNSYNAGDGINQMDWQRAEYNAKLIDYTRRVIALRKKYKAFRLQTTEEIKNQVRLSVAEGGTVFYDIDCVDHETNTSTIRVIMNPSFDEKIYNYEPDWQIVLDEDGNSHPEKTGTIVVPSLCVIVCVR